VDQNQYLDADSKSLDRHADVQQTKIAIILYHINGYLGYMLVQFTLSKKTEQ